MKARFQTIEDIDQYPFSVIDLDQDEVARLHDEWSAVLPQPYEQAATALDMSDTVVIRTLREAIREDNTLSNEEKWALSHQLIERHESIVSRMESEGRDV